ncbi:hypothetical protein [Xenorhabdus sp. Sc-CR9]|uniref:hypothetical protein n=1 Tax=Xenorhabdus sp. Sc-CR9 TaxID=2584468 RepID=UPI001F4484BD|nr:hypothetical protein [Xenorhabdus sp. Sc-CR9]
MIAVHLPTFESRYCQSSGSEGFLFFISMSATSIHFVFQTASLLAALAHPGHIVIYAPGDYERLLPFTGGQPLAGQIRSRRICHSLVAAMQPEIHCVCV